MCFALKKNIFNYKDIYCFFFFNNSDPFIMINVYSDDHQSASKHIWDRLQYDIKSPRLFSFICAKSSISGLVLYLFLLPNYFLQTLQSYLDFM